MVCTAYRCTDGLDFTTSRKDKVTTGPEKETIHVSSYYLLVWDLAMSSSMGTSSQGRARALGPQIWAGPDHLTTHPHAVVPNLDLRHTYDHAASFQSPACACWIGPRSNSQVTIRTVRAGFPAGTRSPDELYDCSYGSSSSCIISDDRAITGLLKVLAACRLPPAARPPARCPLIRKGKENIVRRARGVSDKPAFRELTYGTMTLI